MKQARLLFLLSFLLLLILVACTGPKTTPASHDPTPAPNTPAPTRTPAPDTPAPTPEASIELMVLYTNDEHGWMAGKKEGSGAAEMLGLWQERFGYDQADSRFIVLSGGDNWTGPAISTWFKGESMVEIMNAMGYDASTLGNHEFDFGLEVLQARTQQAQFPYLAANMQGKENSQLSRQLGLQPYTLLDAGGVKVGIIGLANVDTPKVSNPMYSGQFNFEPYVKTLTATLPQMRAQGAEIILVSSHLCNEALRSLAASVADLDITLFGGGHCHQILNEKSGEAVLLTSGSYLQNVAWAMIRYNPSTKRAEVSDYGVEKNKNARADAALASIIEKWQAEVDESLGQPIGYLQNTLPRRRKLMQALITESWLLAYPNADVALTNLGGMRDDLPAGPVNIGAILGVMPFDNVLIDVQLTGAQLSEVISQQSGRVAVGGMHRAGLSWALDKNDQPLEEDAIYHVLVNDFMYAGGDDYDLLAEADPNGYNTSIDWRQPVIDWILAQNSTPEQPLDAAIRALEE
jgi:2',3'-cyclic-nucleotide 2'-phosphodiesterase (5'-nucleotidase family)